LRPELDAVEEPGDAGRNALDRVYRVGDQAHDRLHGLGCRVPRRLEEHIRVARSLEMLDGRQLGNPGLEQLAPGGHEGPEPRAEGEVPEQAVGGDPIVHFEVGTGEHVPRQELARAEHGRRLKGRLRQRRRCREPDVRPRQQYPTVHRDSLPLSSPLPRGPSAKAAVGSLVDYGSVQVPETTNPPS
jgi:hypothetical protein